CCYRDMPAGFDRGPSQEKPNTDRAIDLLRQLVADFPKVPDYRLDLCDTLGKFGPPDRPGGAGPGARRRGPLARAGGVSRALGAARSSRRAAGAAPEERPAARGGPTVPGHDLPRPDASTHPRRRDGRGRGGTAPGRRIRAIPWPRPVRPARPAGRPAVTGRVG